MRPGSPSTGPSSSAEWGSNLALDFINTEYGAGARHWDCFVCYQSVVDWLKLAGVVPVEFGEAPKGLLALARQLRESAKALVGAAKTGVAAEPAVVNSILELGRPEMALE